MGDPIFLAIFSSLSFCIIWVAAAAAITGELLLGCHCSCLQENSPRQQGASCAPPAPCTRLATLQSEWISCCGRWWHWQRNCLSWSIVLPRNCWWPRLQDGDLLLQSSSILQHGVIFRSSSACLCGGALVEGVGTVVPTTLGFAVGCPHDHALLFG